jgi:ABC-type uncharacterized transport system permease subunit
MSKEDITYYFEIYVLTTGSITRFGVSRLKAEKLIRESNVLPMLMQRPDFVHHEGAESWADTIAMQNNLAR